MAWKVAPLAVLAAILLSYCTAKCPLKQLECPDGTTCLNRTHLCQAGKLCPKYAVDEQNGKDSAFPLCVDSHCKHQSRHRRVSYAAALCSSAVDECLCTQMWGSSSWSCVATQTGAPSRRSHWRNSAMESPIARARQTRAAFCAQVSIIRTDTPCQFPCGTLHASNSLNRECWSYKKRCLSEWWDSSLLPKVHLQ